MSFDRPAPRSTPQVKAILDPLTVSRIVEQTTDIEIIIQNILKARREGSIYNQPRSK